MGASKVRPDFWNRLDREIEGEVTTGLFERGRYATDASIYQAFPAGVAFPKTDNDLRIIMEMAREKGVPVTARGGGSSLMGQALGEGLIVDMSRYFTRMVSIDPVAETCIAQAGMTPAALNHALRESGLFCPVALVSSRQATLGGMLANNSIGLRGLRYGSTGDVVQAADATLSDGQRVRFGEVTNDDIGSSTGGGQRLLDVLHFGEQHEKAIRGFAPKTSARRPAADGYNLECLLPSPFAHSLSRLFAGSEGTLAIVSQAELKLAKRPEHRALGACRFTDVASALKLVPSILTLEPSVVELLDSAMLGNLRQAGAGDSQVSRVVQGDAGALLLVEFDDANPVDNTRNLKALDDIVSGANRKAFSVIEIIGQNAQSALWRAWRGAVGLSMSSKAGEGTPIFATAVVVPEAVAGFAAEVDALFASRWPSVSISGHVGLGCFQIRARLVDAGDQRRSLQEATAGLSRKFGGSISGGYGFGIGRSELLERAGGAEKSRLFLQMKALLDPAGILNPGKIVNGPRFDDIALFRKGAAASRQHATALPTGDDRAAVLTGIGLVEEPHCTGLTLCQSSPPRFSCPSYNVTLRERDGPRGRANSVRLALSGELGPDALGSADMAETMRLCVSCKACRTRCPNGIDIPKMKVETLVASKRQHSVSNAHDLFARLPHHTQRATKWRRLLNLRDLAPGGAGLSERYLGIARDRPWPRISGRPFRERDDGQPGEHGRVALFADTFNQTFEPANLRAAANILEAGGYAVTLFRRESDAAPLCCGRTFYDAGYLDEARAEAYRFIAAFSHFHEQGIPVVGLEPVCALMMRDEYANLGLALPDKAKVWLFEEFIASRIPHGEFVLPFKTIEADLLVQPHCHERAHAIDGATHAAFSLVPGLTLSSPPAACCGFNGLVGLTPDTLEPSLAMAELALFPAIRQIGRDALIAASGFSCRRQIVDGLGVTARHPSMIMNLALTSTTEIVS